LRIAFAVVLACLLLATHGAAFAQTNDVPRDHWAYQAVQDLASRGYVTGSPVEKFIGDRTITRYEFATIVKRILDNLDSKMMNEQTRQSVTKDDEDKIYKLGDEFQVELVVIGTKLNRPQSADASETDKKLAKIAEIVTDPEGPVEATKADVAKLKRLTVGGYVQARYEDYPGGVDEDGKAIQSGLSIRRARVKVTGKPTDTTTAILQLDMGADKTAIKDAYVEFCPKGNSEIGLDVVAGQMNWPFGYEVPYSSSRRETPERALWSRRLFTGERDTGVKITYPFTREWFGQIGLYNGAGIDALNSVTTVVTDSTTTPPKTAKIKIPGTVGRDYDNNKDIIANLQYNGVNSEFGLSAYLGKGIWNPDRAALIGVPKTRFGADFRYYLNNLTLKAEFVTAKGVDEAVSGYDNSKWVTGYDVQLGYNIGVSNTLVAKYETLSEDPKYPIYGRRSAWNLGVLHWFDSNTRLKVFYTINQEQSSPINNNVWRVECLTTY
jgi:hypothetical protein